MKSFKTLALLLFFPFLLALFFLSKAYFASINSSSPSLPFFLPSRAVPSPPPLPSITLTFVGDVGLGRSVNFKIHQYDFRYPFASTAALLRSADLTFANLEGPLVAGCPLTTSGMRFCAPPENIQSLLFAGIDLVSVANNHIFDYGQSGFEQTIAALKQVGIEPVGFDSHPIKEVRGVRFGFLAYDLVSHQLDPQTLKADLASVRPQADVVVVSFHWGVEYTDQPTAQQKQLAHLAVDHGADLVIGHHPHWIQPEEQYQDKYIFYSLGNFVFDQMWSQPTRTGLIVTATFQGKKLINIQKQRVLIHDFCQPRLLTFRERTTDYDPGKPGSQL